MLHTGLRSNIFIITDLVIDSCARFRDHSVKFIAFFIKNDCPFAPAKLLVELQKEGDMGSKAARHADCALMKSLASVGKSATARTW